MSQAATGAGEDICASPDVLSLMKLLTCCKAQLLCPHPTSRSHPPCNCRPHSTPPTCDAMAAACCERNVAKKQVEGRSDSTESRSAAISACGQEVGARIGDTRHARTEGDHNMAAGVTNIPASRAAQQHNDTAN